MPIDVEGFIPTHEKDYPKISESNRVGDLPDEAPINDDGEEDWSLAWKQDIPENKR